MTKIEEEFIDKNNFAKFLIDELIISLLAKKLGYSPEKLAKLFNDPKNELNRHEDWNDLINYWNKTIEERVRLSSQKNERKDNLM